MEEEDNTGLDETPLEWTEEKRRELTRSLQVRRRRQIVSGQIVVDSSYFDADNEAKGWEQEDSDRAYAAPVGALSLNYNTVNVIVNPGPHEGSLAQVQVDPPSTYIKVDSRVSTSRWGGRVYMQSRQDGKYNKVRLRGRIGSDAGPRKIYRRVADPAVHFGAALAGLFNDGGIRVRHVGDECLLIAYVLFDLFELSLGIRDLLSQLFAARDELGLIFGRRFRDLRRRLFLLMSQRIDPADALASCIAQGEKRGQVDIDTPLTTVFGDGFMVVADELQIQHRDLFRSGERE